jgi:hypothetical protein
MSFAAGRTSDVAAAARAIAGSPGGCYRPAVGSSRTIFVTQKDLDRLTRLLETHGSRRDSEARAALEEELGRAVVVESAQIPPDVVTMNSRVRFEDLDTGEQLEVALVYPHDADVDQGGSRCSPQWEVRFLAYRSDSPFAGRSRVARPGISPLSR